MSKSSFPSIDRSVIEPICLPQNKLGHQLFILREDLIHPIISGNKWRKLKYVFEHVKAHQFDGIISYGGAYSNHLVACAAAAKLCNEHTILENRSSSTHRPSCYPHRRLGHRLDWRTSACHHLRVHLWGLSLRDV